MEENTNLSGVELIAKERARQKQELGYDALHDAEHQNQELVWAAVAYALDQKEFFPENWDAKHFKTDGEIYNLTVAGALIAAEIDRLMGIGDTTCPNPSAPTKPFDA